MVSTVATYGRIVAGLGLLIDRPNVREANVESEAIESKYVEMPLRVRYYEADMQGVVFNMWYLAYFEDARNAYLDSVGYSLSTLLASGLDIQVVATRIEWHGPVRWNDTDVSVVAYVTRLGVTSVTFAFAVRCGGAELVSGETVYVIVEMGQGGKKPVPEGLRQAIGLVAGEAPDP